MKEAPIHFVLRSKFNLPNWKFGASLKRGRVKMYKYIYVEAKAATIFKAADHREIIDKYSKEGWRFVSSIPTASGAQGAIVKYDLVFEKEE